MSTITQTIKIAHSPDSDDAFMFYAIREKKIDLEGLEFEFTSAEIELLNQEAIQGSESADIFAVSFHSYAYIQDRYTMLLSGASMGGVDYGPRVIARESTLGEGLIRIAVPGKHTSAYLAMRAYEKQNFKTDKFIPVFCSYDEVFNLLERGQVDASLLIHEAQLRYGELGYKLIVDLGAWWQATYKLNLPLGCNVASNKLGKDRIKQIDAILKHSILWGLENLDEALEFSRNFANNNLDDIQARKYIDMYVNQSTIELGRDDLKSVEILLSTL